VSFNPDMDTDDTFRRFVTNSPPDAIVIKINYTDNPWKSAVLDAERERMRVESPEDFAHIYLGECRPAVEGAIYYNEVSALKNSGRLMNVPYDPMLKAHIIADLGFNDFMAMLVVQRRASEIRIIRYIEDRFRDVPFYSAELRNLNYNWGSVWLPHDARAKTLAAASNTLGATVKEQFQNLGWKCEDVPNIELEQGIRKTREVFGRFHVDKANAGDLVSRWGRYRRRVNSEGQGSTPMHDDASHGADGTRYLAIVADQLTNESEVLHVDVNSAFRRRA
jgi:phage terminase large subunit